MNEEIALESNEVVHAYDSHIILDGLEFISDSDAAAASESELVFSLDREIRIQTGVSTGPVSVKLVLHENPRPHSLSELDWDEFVEFTARYLPNEQIAVHGSEEFATVKSTFPEPRQGWPQFVRVRIAACDRKVAWDLVVTMPVSRFVFELWPGDPTDTSLIASSGAPKNYEEQGIPRSEGVEYVNRLTHIPATER